MDPEVRRLLQKNIELSEENNKILHKMRRNARFTVAFRIFYWVVIIGAGLGVFYFLQPYIDKISETYAGVKSSSESVLHFRDSLKNIMK